MRPASSAASQACATACVAVLTSVLAAQTAALPDYEPAQTVSGTIRVWGSPQMGDLLKLYEQGFAKVQPAVHFDNELKSTLTAVAGVYTGRAEIGLLGREIWPTEVQAFESIERHSPTVIEIATGSYDVPKATFALMIFVPKDNPIVSLSIEQLDRIFAFSDHQVRTWGDLGLKDGWASRPIHLYGFSVDNDKSQIFSQLVFQAGRRWTPTLHEFSNAAGPNGADAGELIVQAVAHDPEAIGISNVHYATRDVKALAISLSGDEPAIPPTRENVANRTYPLTRAVYMLLNADAAHSPSAAVLKFLHYVLSRRGQQAVTQQGNYIPLTPEVALKQLQQLPAASK